MIWCKLNFGKHTGRTLPQVVLSDPNWFFWAVSKSVFDRRLGLESEADALARRARNIRIPKRHPKEWEVEYRWDRENRFLGCGFVKAKGSFQARFSSRLPHLDLACVRRGNIHRHPRLPSTDPRLSAALFQRIKSEQAAMRGVL